MAEVRNVLIAMDESDFANFGFDCKYVCRFKRVKMSDLCLAITISWVVFQRSKLLLIIIRV